VALTDLDRRIWLEELEGLVPARVFDVHTHVYRWEFNTDPTKDSGPYAEMVGRVWPESTWELLDACDAELMPGRTVERLCFGFPFTPACDFLASNRFAAAQVAGKGTSRALMLVEPSMTADAIERQIDELGLVGLKPYRFYSRTGDAVDCRITDFLPEHQIAVADRRGLIVMLHLSRRQGIADPENLADLDRLTGRYANVKWILAHCARSYAAWAIEQAGDRLRRWPNVWYDTSSVCESDAIEALAQSVGPDRVMYGSDDLPVGVLRGKYIAFARAWAFLSETNHSLNLSHCDPRMTLTRYEQLRAAARTARRLGLSREDIDNLFYGTARRLVDSASCPALLSLSITRRTCPYSHSSKKSL
jgi:glutamate-1-semialdehyde 2,1-aminomutase